MYAIEFDRVWKSFKRGERATSLRDAIPHLFKKIVTGSTGQRANGPTDKTFWALRDVSFKVKKGEVLGIIGPNGAGKTTILKLLAGIMKPNKGNVKVNGRLSALIEVGAGFHPDLTGRENVYLNGSIMGMTRKEINKKFDSIVDFAGSGLPEFKKFIDTPVKRYSSGMYVRLGFSIAAHVDPKILLVDEVLAVGDTSFQHKCFNKLAELRKKGVTTILVSHNMQSISGFSGKVLYLSQSKMRYYGDVGTAIKIYKEDIGSKVTRSATEFELSEVRGSGLVRITKVEFLNKDERVVNEIKSGEALIFRIHFEAKRSVGAVELDVGIRCGTGERFFQGTNTAYKKNLVISKKRGYIDVQFKNFCMNDQKALFFFALWKKDRSELFDWKREVPFNVIYNPLLDTKVFLDTDWVVKENQADI